MAVRERQCCILNNGKSSTSKARLNLGQAAIKVVKQPKMDELLEDTLINNINIAEPLTKREAEVLRLIVSGKTNKEIAQTLCRAQRTIEYHRNRLMRKLNVHGIADLVKLAFAMGIT